MAVRLLMLQSHYRSSVNFTWESLDAANNRLLDLRALAALQWQPIPTDLPHDATTMSFEDVGIELAKYLQDDLGTPQALAFLSDVSKQIQTVLIDTAMVARLQAMLRDIDTALGLRLADEPDITREQKQSITAREQARADRDWAKSDELRDELQKQGIGLRDTEHGAIWHRL
ncbi:MAG: DALR domain-containing protein [Candidatus Saccharibacteria bacterium]